jgi:hypothetical protein
MQDAEFGPAARLRLQLRLRRRDWQPVTSPCWRCSIERGKPVPLSLHHSFTCALTKGFVTCRHNLYRTMLYNIIRAATRDDGYGWVEALWEPLMRDVLHVEPRMQNGAPHKDAAGARADVAIIRTSKDMSQQLWAVDVVGCHRRKMSAAQREAAAAPGGPADEKGVTARAAEVRKYDQYTSLHLIQTNEVVPWAVETGGRLGQVATDFLVTICKLIEQAHTKRHGRETPFSVTHQRAAQRLSVCWQQGNARILRGMQGIIDDQAGVVGAATAGGVSLEQALANARSARKQEGRSRRQPTAALVPQSARPRAPAAAAEQEAAAAAPSAHSDGDSDGSAGDDDGLIGLAALDQLNPAATQAGGGEASHADTAAGSGPGGGDRSAAGDHGSGSGSASSSGAGAPRNDAARKLQQQREAMDRLSSSRRVRFDRRAPQAAPPELEPDLDEDAAELETLVDIQTAAELMAATHGGLPDSVLLRAAAAGVNLAAGTPSGSVRYAYRASRAQQPEPELNERAQATTMNRVASVTGARGGTTGMDPGSRQAAPPAAAASGSGRLGQFMPRPTAQGVSAPPLAR